MAQFGSQDMTAVTKHLLLNINPLFQRKGVIKRTDPLVHPPSRSYQTNQPLADRVFLSFTQQIPLNSSRHVKRFFPFFIQDNICKILTDLGGATIHHIGLERPPLTVLLKIRLENKH